MRSSGAVRSGARIAERSEWSFAQGSLLMSAQGSEPQLEGSVNGIDIKNPDPRIPRFASTLQRAGYPHCIVVFKKPGYIRQLPLTVKSDPPSDMAYAHLVTIDEPGFQKTSTVS